LKHSCYAQLCFLTELCDKKLMKNFTSHFQEFKATFADWQLSVFQFRQSNRFYYSGHNAIHYVVAVQTDALCIED